MNPTDVSSNTPFKIGSANFEPVYWRLNETISKVCEVCEPYSKLFYNKFSRLLLLLLG